MPSIVSGAQPGRVGPWLSASTAAATYEQLRTFARSPFNPDLARARLPRTPLVTATPDGSGEVTHTSAVYRPAGWNGYKWWLAATPYPDADNTLENPCLWFSNDAETWTPVNGNPIEAAPGSPAYNSDPHLVFAGSTLYCFWRTFDSAVSGAEETIYYRASTDGADWSDKQTVLTNDYTVRRLYSPAVVYDADAETWHMWAVDGVADPQTIVHLTASSPTGAWSSPQICTLSPGLPSGKEPWHLDVQLVDGRFYMLLLDNTVDSSGGDGDLYFASSVDGEAWTRGGERLLPRQCGFGYEWYRSALVPAEGGFELILSSVGAGTGSERRASRSTLTFNGDLPEPVRHASSLAGALTGSYPYLLADTFNRSDAAVGTADFGGAWSVYAGSPVIISNKLTTASSANTKLVLDAGASDVYAEITISALSLASQDCWVIVRAQDTSNYLRVGWSNFPLVTKVVAGSSTVISSSAFPLGSQPSFYPIRVGVLCVGDQLQVYINGDPYGDPITESTFETETNFGIQFDTANTTVDDFFVRAAV